MTMTRPPADPAISLILQENTRLLESLRPVQPGEGLMERLRAISRSMPARVEATETLGLLIPGTLAPPPFSPDLRARLGRIPSIHPRRAAAPTAPKRSRFPAFLLDWRVSVAVAYAAAALVVAILGVDPLSAARKTAFDLASTGQEAIEEARDAARKRIATASFASRPEALSRQLDYRLYRSVEVSKAKAVAWGSVVLDRVFGQTDAQPARAGQREGPGAPRTGLPEPDGPDFRS
jgi:hypothetical protein